MALLGVVVIGRNEGERLRRCLTSISGQGTATVYVDSGSSDGSCEFAQSVGVHTVQLDLSIPFTAARARNEGLRRLLGLHPEVELVQFVDGDCEMVPGWLALGQEAMAAHLDTAVVVGRVRERYPGASAYNRLCDMEWDTPVGELETCGGIAMMRVGPVQKVGGFRETLIAGEEPDLCVRLRSQGWKIRRLDAEMTLHDAAMTRLGQWWKRSIRNGHAYGECSWLHRKGPIRLWARETRSNWVWGLVLPLVLLALAPFYPWVSLGLFVLLYLVLGLRVYRHRRRRGNPRADARLYACFCVLGKFPNMLGQLRYHRNRLLARTEKLIEYK